MRYSIILLVVALAIPAFASDPKKNESGKCMKNKYCKFGLYCDGADIAKKRHGKCRYRRYEGKSCVVGIKDCQKGLFCKPGKNPKKGTCKLSAKKEPGDARPPSAEDSADLKAEQVDDQQNAQLENTPEPGGPNGGDTATEPNDSPEG